MSFQELRTFTEIMSSLGYNRLISMENFRTPNFPLVAEILIWLIKRIDPEADIHQDFNTEEDRVMLVRSAAQFLVVKPGITINTKRIYQGDGYAVRELLKICTVIHNALQVTFEKSKPSAKLTARDDLSSKIEELKLSRELASQVTMKGATLFELLGKEVELRQLRKNSISGQVDLRAIEAGLKEAIAFAKESIENTKSLIENVAATESSLDSKIEKKQAELERNQKRLMTLKKVRPAFLEEFEKVESELEIAHQEYVSKLRCVAYLEQQEEEAAAQEQENLLRRQKEARRIMEELQLDDSRKILEDDDDLEAMPQEKADKPNRSLDQQPTRRLRTATAAKTRVMTGKKRVYGGMTIPDDESLDSDSDLILDDDDDDDDDDVHDDDNSLVASADNPLESTRSDDDF